jgi:uncharacterized RDD family membrane protein YckC
MPRSASLALIGVPLRNWRTPGARITGIRSVDKRTGGPVTVHSALVGEAAGAAFGFLVRRLTAPLHARSHATQAKLQTLGPEMTALQRAYADDRDAQPHAFQDFYKANDVNPLGSALWLLPGVLVMPLTALLSRQRQTIRDRVSGTLRVRSQ